MLVIGAAINSILLFGNRPAQIVNLLSDSNDFGAASWDASSSTGTITTGQPDSDGGTDASTLSDVVGSGNNNRIQQLFTSEDGTTYTYDLIAKQNTQQHLFMFSGDLIGSYFNLATGSLGSTVGTVVNRTIADLGGGFYRCQMSITATRVMNSFTIEVVNADGSSLANAGDSIDIYKARLFVS